MSRFGLRNRVKSALGLGRSQGKEEALPVTFVLPDGQEKQSLAEERYTLVMASQQLATPIAIGCPDGHCGECVVEVLSGAAALAPPTAAESKAFEHHAGRPAKDGERLACHARVVGPGARVRVKRVWTLDDQRGV